MSKPNLPKIFFATFVAAFLSLPFFAQDAPSYSVEVAKTSVEAPRETAAERKIRKRYAKFLRKLAGEWRYSKQVFMVSLDGNRVKIENVGFYLKCKFRGTTGRVWTGEIIGNQIKGTYNRTYRGKTFDIPFTAEIARNGKSMLLNYKEVRYIDPIGSMPGEYVQMRATDRLRKR